LRGLLLLPLGCCQPQIAPCLLAIVGCWCFSQMGSLPIRLRSRQIHNKRLAVLYLALAIVPLIGYTSLMEKTIQATSHTPVNQTLVYAGIWFAVISWGTSFVAARTLLHAEGVGQTSLSPTVLAALRFSIASLFFLFPLTKAVLRRQVSLRSLLLMACLGQSAFSLYFWLQYTGVQNTNAS